ncbi:hypothetical protein ACE01N_07225 [Saccharicrinis sp. FJH2]|uniref:hypothetical protein n=1 Tax=Saccharicrinis sp. FJH65 TaxID=3344659 RepID=UPI0035F387B1
MSLYNIINWLLSGDVSIQYQVHRDLLRTERKYLRSRIAKEGWGKMFLSKQRPDGHWGLKFYQPKWTSTHYTLLDLKNLAIDPDINSINTILTKILKEEKASDGGVNPIGTVKVSDVCLNGMFLNYASYFKSDPEELKSVVDFVLTETMTDGGFNCWSNRSGASHSSLHTTLSVLEGIDEYRKNGYTYRLDELTKAESTSREFILMHHLYKSDKTGMVIKKDFLRMPYPCRWRYDILKAMDYFQCSGSPWDNRMYDATRHLITKRNKQQTWNLQAPYPGKIHFEMETVGQPSRWNTLRMLRILKAYNPNLFQQYMQ